jgi:hypothetical protein
VTNRRPQPTQSVRSRGRLKLLRRGPSERGAATASIRKLGRGQSLNYVNPATAAAVDLPVYSPHRSNPSLTEASMRF